MLIKCVHVFFDATHMNNNIHKNRRDSNNANSTAAVGFGGDALHYARTVPFLSSRKVH
jgi:hypothetical protein